MRTLLTAGLSLVVSGFLASSALAIPLSFHADLTEDQVVPAISSLVLSSGTFDLTIDAGVLMFDFRFELNSIENPLLQAHIHGPAPVGQNAGVVQPLFDLTGVPIEITGDNIVIRDSISNPNAELLTQLTTCAAGGAGSVCNFYINVHTQAFPNGELRGQLSFVPEPASLLLLGLGAVASVIRRRSS